MLENRFKSISVVIGLVLIVFLFPSHALSQIDNTVLLGEEFLEEGFPIYIPLQSGMSYFPDYFKVANIDSDAELEIVLKPQNSELCAWNHDGTIVSGWPLPDSFPEGGFVLGEFDKQSPGLEIFNGFEESGYGEPCSMAIYSGNGSPINGWPFLDCDYLYGFRTPTATDLDNDGIDELIITTYSKPEVVVFGANGLKYDSFSPPPKPPEVINDYWDHFASGDIDGDGLNEIVGVVGAYDVMGECYRWKSYLYAYNRDGTILDNFPIIFNWAGESRPLLTDVNGDNIPEIIILEFTSCLEEIEYNAYDVFKIISGDGSLLNQIFIYNENFVPGTNVSYLTGACGVPFYYLGDLDNDEKAEILFMTTDKKLWAYKTDGTVMPGWPVEGDESGIAIGDIDGDKLPEIVTIIDYDGEWITDDQRNYVVVYDHDGKKKENLTIVIDYMGNTASYFQPAIADIDNDGRNEVIVVGDYWGGQSGYFPQIWAFDFGGADHGAIQYSQYGVDAKSSGLVVPPPRVITDDNGGGGSGGSGTCFISTAAR